MKKKVSLFLTALLLTVLATVSSIDAKASGGLELYTDYPGISAKAGDDQSISMYVANDSGSAVEVSLTVSSLPDGWTGYFTGDGSEVSRVHVQDGDEIDVDFQLEIPDDEELGTYTVVLEAVSDTGLTDTLELTFEIAETAYGEGSLDIEYPEQEGASGTSYSFSATLINNSAAAQTYSLSANAPSGWTVYFTPSSESTYVASVEVEAESSEGLTISVTPPTNVEAGEYTIPISAISGSESLSGELSVTVTGTYEITLSSSTGALSFDAYVNKEADVVLTVTNNSNVDLENITLSSSAPTDWTVTFEQSTIETLESGATAEITAHVTPSDTAITGDYEVDFSAECDETSDSAAFRVSVKTQTIWGIVAILIIVLLLLGISWVFKKYGRR